LNPTFRVSSGLIDPKHLRRMGASLKVFLWCVDRQTDPDGSVLYGGPVKLSQIASSTGVCIRTTRTYLARLVRDGYLTVLRAAHGVRITVANQKKWRRSDRQERSDHLADHFADHLADQGPCDRQETATLIKNGRARDLHLKTATTTEREVFTPATPMDPAAALCVRNPDELEAHASAYYSAEDLALMPARTRALVERLAAPDYDPILAGDCRRCHTGPRAIGELCVDCAPRLVRPALREVHA